METTESHIEVVAADPIRAAFEGRDHAAIVALAAPDIIFRSPVTPTPFHGREAFAKAMEGLMKGTEKWADDWHITHVRRDADTYQITAGARIRGQDGELVSVITLDDDGMMREMRVYGRPMATMAAVALAAMPGVAGLRGRTRSLLVWLLIRPLPRLLKLGVSVAMWLGAPLPPKTAKR